MEPGTLLKLWEENEYFLPAATEWDSDDEISNWEAVDFEQGLTPQQMQAAYLYYIELRRQVDIAREIGVTPRTIANWWEGCPLPNSMVASCNDSISKSRDASGRNGMRG